MHVACLLLPVYREPILECLSCFAQSLLCRLSIFVLYMKGILHYSYLLLLLLTCNFQVLSFVKSLDSTTHITNQTNAPSTLTLRMRDKHSRKSIFGQFIVQFSDGKKTLIETASSHIVTFNSEAKLTITAQAEGYQTQQRTFQILLAPFGKHYEYEAFMEKAVGVIRINALDEETKRPAKKVNFFVKNTYTEEVQKYLSISSEGIVYLNLFDSPLKYELEISAKGYEPIITKLDSSSLDRVLTYLMKPVKRASVVIPIVAQDILTKDLIPVIEVASTNLKLTETKPYKVLLVDDDEIDVEVQAKEYHTYNKHFVVTDTLLNLSKLVVPMERNSYTFLLKSWEDQELTEHIHAVYKVYDLETNTQLPQAYQGVFPMVELMPHKEYSIHVTANGYEPIITRFAPLGAIMDKQFSKDFILKKKRTIVKIEPNSIIKSKEFGIIEKGKAITLRNLYFDQSSPVLRKESFQELDSLVSLMLENPTLKLEIRGHTDNVGDFNLNLKLSQERCQSVIFYLISKGIQSERLKAVGRGPLEPVVPNNSEENKKKNRRVEFIRQ